MKFELDLTTHVPIYLQIMSQVKHAIATGELQPDDQLPTVRQLAADLRVNFNTVARAYRQLDEEGVISTQHGRGTFILEQGSAKDVEKLRQEDLAALADNFLEGAERLDFSVDEIRKLIKKKLDDWTK